MAYTVVNGKLVRTRKPQTRNMYSGRYGAVPNYGNEDAPVKMPEDKGLYMGSCNRSDCLGPNAEWYNRGSHAFYCRACAWMLNDANKFDKFCKEVPLCYKVKSKEEASELHLSR